MKKILSLSLLLLTFISTNTYSQIITTIAGNGIAGYSGDGGPATAAVLNSPDGIAKFGNNLYVGEVYSNCVRKINLSTGIITTFAGTGVAGHSGDGGPATNARLTTPYGLAVDDIGNVYIADEGNYVVRKVDTLGVITTFAGTGTFGFSGDGGQATAAKMTDVNGVAADHHGNIYIGDQSNYCIRKVNSAGVITTVAGTPLTSGYGGDGGPATAAIFQNIPNVYLDSIGNIYVADFYSNRLRKIDTSGIIRTIGGTGVMGYSGDGGAATAAKCYGPLGIYVEQSGNIYFNDCNNNVLRKINTSGIITTIAGTGTAGYSGDGGPATAATLRRCAQVLEDASGTIYICDYANNVVRMVAPTYGIFGPSAVCVGGTMTLTVSIPGGTWSSTNTAIATVGSTSGVVAGVAAGLDTIYYTYGAILISKIITVNTLPSIVGASSVCAAGTTTLIGIPPGGTWSVSNTSASIGSLSGIVSGVTSGVDTISYTLLTGCTTTKIITVNPNPAPISGPAGVCVGGTGTLSDTTTGGVWSSSNVGIATIGSSSGIVTFVSSGCATITYTVGSCYATHLLCSNPAPSLFSVTGCGSYCVGGTGVLVGLGGSATGVTYQLYNGVTMVGLPVAGTGAAISFGTLTAAGTYTVVATITATGCSRTMSGSATIAISPLPTLFAITGGGSYCAGGTGVVVGLSGSVVGVTYQLYNGVTMVGSPVAGTGAAISFGTLTAAGTYTVVATNTATGCSSTMLGSATIMINPVPIAYPVYIGAPGIDSICSGATGDHIILGGSTIGISYQLVVGGAPVGLPMTGTGGMIDFGAYTTPGVYTIIAVNPATTCANVMGPVRILPAPGIISGPGTVCIGSTITLTDLTGGGVWSSSNAHAGVGSISGVVTGVTAGTSTITYALATGCYTTQTVTVSAVGTISGSLMVCTGGTTTLTYSLPGGIWSSSSPTIATIGSSSGIVTGISPGICVFHCPAFSACAASVVVTVNPLPTAYAVIGGGNHCAGTCVHVGLSNSDPGVSYQLYNGIVTVGAPVAGFGGPLDFGCLATPGTYTIVATATATGCIRNMSGSAVISISPSPSVISGPSAVCVGATITETDSISGGSWSSSAPTIASIGSTTGAVTGNAIGTTTISYTLPSGCFSTKTVSVSVSPLPIIGGATICSGDTMTMTDPIGGGDWVSSAITTAIIGSSTGLVTGMSGGVATITYSLGTGCSTIKTMTVNASPAAITGSMSLCAGHTTTLSCTTTGGAWSSGAIGIAGVGSTGIVTGVSAGMAGITYTLASGCRSTATVTVNALPPTITGITHVCIAATTLLSDATGGGTWTSSPTVVATVGSGTGVVTGVTAGTTTVTYSLGAGCIATIPVTVNSNPVGIGGASALCAGATATVTDVTTGGTWSSPSTGIAMIGSGTGIITGVAAGIDTIRYTLGSGCMATKAVTVNAKPLPITGATSVCVGQSTTLTDGTPGVTWSSSAPAIATAGSATGIVSGVSVGTVTIICGLATGCTTTTTLSVTTPSVITGTASVCVGALTTLSDVVTGGIWSSSATTIAMVGSASGIVTGVTAGTAAITYIPVAGCAVTKIVTVNPLPATITGMATICMGTTTALSDATGGGTWSSSNTAVATVGTSSGIVYGAGTGAATITYSATYGCKTTWPMTVYPTPSSITGPSSTMCAGHTITLSDATPGGSWSSSNTTIATVSTTGVVTGGTTSGSATISYAISTGCAATRIVSVIAVPPIMGLRNLCAWGDSVTVYDSLVTGLYSSTLATVVNFGGGMGVVTSYAPGIAHVTYTLPSGCSVTATLTVNPIPGLIVGSTHIAVGGTTTLTNSVPGGTWSSGATTIAGVGSATGLVTGVAAGSAHITYTLSTGCNADTVVHVAAARPSGSGYQTLTGGGEISVIPNPNKGAFTISGTLETLVKQDGEVWLELTDMIGQVVYKNKVLCHDGKIEENISVSNIANGMYLLSVRWGDGSRVVHVAVNP